MLWTVSSNRKCPRNVAFDKKVLYKAHKAKSLGNFLSIFERTICLEPFIPIYNYWVVLTSRFWRRKLIRNAWDQVCFEGVQLSWGVFWRIQWMKKNKILLITGCTPAKQTWSNSLSHLPNDFIVVNDFFGNWSSKFCGGTAVLRSIL